MKGFVKRQNRMILTKVAQRNAKSLGRITIQRPAEKHVNWSVKGRKRLRLQPWRLFEGFALSRHERVKQGSDMIRFAFGSFVKNELTGRETGGKEESKQETMVTGTRQILILTIIFIGCIVLHCKEFHNFYSFKTLYRWTLRLFTNFRIENYKCYNKHPHAGTSLVEQWLRIRLPMQGTRVQALVQEDPTCHEATKPMHHN